MKLCIHTSFGGVTARHDRYGTDLPSVSFWIADESTTALDVTIQAQIP